MVRVDEISSSGTAPSAWPKQTNMSATMLSFSAIIFSHFCPLGWNVLLLFAIFENATDQVLYCIYTFMSSIPKIRPFSPRLVHHFVNVCPPSLSVILGKFSPISLSDILWAFSVKSVRYFVEIFLHACKPFYGHFFKVCQTFCGHFLLSLSAILWTFSAKSFRNCVDIFRQDCPPFCGHFLPSLSEIV